MKVAFAMPSRRIGRLGRISRRGSRNPGGVRSSRKRAATRTKTRLGFGKRRKNSMKRVAPRVSIGGGGTFSRFSLYSRPSSRVVAMKKVAAPNVRVHNYATQLQIAEGFQGVTIATWNGLPQLKEVLAQITATPTVGNPPTQYVLESNVAEMLITNSSLATMYCDVYDLCRRRDNNVATFSDVGNPYEAWKAGIFDETTGAIPDGSVYVNSIPTDSRLFKDYFKVLKRTSVSLAQGATHRHAVSLKPNRLIDQSLLSRANGDLAGVTCYTMIVAYGQPCSIPQEPPASALVTTASGYLDFVTAVRLKYTYVQDRTTNWTVEDNLVSLAGEQIVSAGAGTIVPNQKV